jgi:hypothetical protein
MPTAPIALQTPVFLLQHVDAQSALLRHCPVINWLPSPLPTFCEPGLLASIAGFAGVAAPLATPGAAALLPASPVAAPPEDDWKPQFSMPTAPIALHRPVFLLQHVEAQSASLRHCPVMNWLPFPLPTLCKNVGVSYGNYWWSVSGKGGVLPFWAPGLLASIVVLPAGVGAARTPSASFHTRVSQVHDKDGNSTHMLI